MRRWSAVHWGAEVSRSRLAAAGVCAASVLVLLVLPRLVLLRAIDVAAVAGFFGGLVFCVTYATLAHWWRSEEGRNIMLVSAGATGLLALRCLTLVFGDGYWGQLQLRFALFAALTVGLWWRWRLMLRAQLANRTRPDDPTLTEWRP